MTRKERLQLLAFMLIAAAAVGGSELVFKEVGPRLARPAAPYALFGFISLVLLVLQGIGFLFMRSSFAERRAKLARSVATNATVTGTRTNKRGSTSVDAAVVRYYAAGAWREEAVAVTRTREVGQQVDVRFDPDDPDWVVLDGRDPVAWKLLVAMYSVYALIMAVGFLVCVVLVPHPIFR